MGRLLDLLQAAAGEASIRTRLGQWRQAVSEVVDGVVAAGSAALSATQFLQAAPSGNVPVTLNSDVVLDTVVAQRGVPYDPATGVATLTGGRTYSLRASGSVANMVGGTPDFLDITWVDANSNAPLEAAVTGTWIPVSDTSTTAAPNAVEVFYAPAADQGVKLRVVGSGGGGGLVVGGHFSAVIQQVG